MTKPNSYHTQQALKTNERLREIQRELPLLCTDFFRSIAQTTSPLTRLAYAYDFRLFFQYLEREVADFANSSVALFGTTELEKVTARDIAGYQEYLEQYVRRTYGVANATGEDQSPVLVRNLELGIMRKLSSLRSFFDYLFKNEKISSNVVNMITLPKRHEKPVLYLESDEVYRLLDAVASGEGLSKRQQAYANLTRQRDTAILLLFLGTGLRVSELVGLDMDDLDLKDNACVVMRKGGNQVVLYYPAVVRDALKSYLIQREDSVALLGHEYALFLSLQKRRMTARAVENMVKKFSLIAAPLKKRISPHKLRSTFATHLYQKTGDIYLVADALGHSDINTTKRHYAAMEDSRRREAAQRITLPDIAALAEEEVLNSGDDQNIAAVAEDGVISRADHISETKEK